MTIAHLSDVHFGRIAYPEIVEVLVDEVNALGVDLVVVSGDLTQRARPAQFAAAVTMLQAFEAPVLVVPGNHDVYAWWHRPFLRMVRPLRRYRHAITDNLMPTFEHNGVVMLGINSAHGNTIKGGRIGAEEQARIETYFADQPDDGFKILVVHHHLTRIEALGKHDIARHAHRTLEAVTQAGVDLILCGHLHISHIEPIEVGLGRRRLVIASAGTATSNRSREPHGNSNLYNVVRITPDQFSIEERRYDPDTKQFRKDDLTVFER